MKNVKFRLITLLLLVSTIGCVKESAPEPPIDEGPCEEILVNDELWEGQQINGSFKGVYNCYEVIGSAGAEHREFKDSTNGVAVSVALFKLWYPKIIVSIDRIPYSLPTPFNLGEDHLEKAEYVVGVISDDLIERVEDSYVVDSTYDNKVEILELSRENDIVRGIINVRLVLEDSKSNQENPDELLFMDCEFTTKFWN